MSAVSAEDTPETHDTEKSTENDLLSYNFLGETKLIINYNNKHCDIARKMLTCLDKYHDFLHIRGKNNISSTLLSAFNYKTLGQKVIQGTTI